MRTYQTISQQQRFNWKQRHSNIAINQIGTNQNVR